MYQETSTKAEDETVKVANGSLVNDSSDSEVIKYSLRRLGLRFAIGVQFYSFDNCD